MGGSIHFIIKVVIWNIQWLSGISHLLSGINRAKTHKKIPSVSKTTSQAFMYKQENTPISKRMRYDISYEKTMANAQNAQYEQKKNANKFFNLSGSNNSGSLEALKNESNIQNQSMDIPAHLSDIKDAEQQPILNSKIKLNNKMESK